MYYRNFALNMLSKNATCKTAKSNKESGKTKGKTCFRSITPRPATVPPVCVCALYTECILPSIWQTIEDLPAPLPLHLLLSRERRREAQRDEACSDLYA